MLNRRSFLLASAAAFASVSFAQTTAPKLRLKKAVKFDMIKTPGSIKDKFELIKRLGFEGVEIDSPSDVNRDEAVRASDDTGIAIHGVIDSVHWKQRLSDPDPAVRAKGVEALQIAIHDAGMYHATTVLLVPGKVTSKETENYDQVWQRSTDEINKVLPLLEKAHTRLAIEVVWNDFLTKPEQLVQYVDQFRTPLVGAYFDVSNMIKYGVPPADWIRALGPRMLKFDFKGYSKEKKWVEIGEGDEDWPEVRKALTDINYTGWATAEVKGGDEARLRDIAGRMDNVLALSSQ